MQIAKKYKIKSRIWICTEEGTFLGEGRIELLKKIDEFGSISKAAKAMKMSYKKAWELVNSMNEQSQEPIVTGKIGGNQKAIAFLDAEIAKIDWK
ncbi:MAG: LysR family transcriptional regulator [Flavobacteriia bacterium]|nr:LysR family transcriptional regulator [Flavobacteriia bacterium]